jgi:NADP-dependent 3-hydroxy acid dehydrogenase YdfG
MNSLAGKNAIVTGASSGIGEGLARMLIEEGVKVALAARRVDRLERIVADTAGLAGEAVAVSTDLTDDVAIRRLVSIAESALGPIDILINSAGVADALRPIHETDLALWDAEFAVNLRAPIALCAAVLPGMRQRKSGFIVNICSEAGASVVPGMGAYCVSKHALRVATEIIEDENQLHGIKAWAICPGEVDTQMADRQHGRSERFLRVDEIVEVVKVLLGQGPNVKMGPEILIRTTLDPFEGSARR